MSNMPEKNPDLWAAALAWFAAHQPQIYAGGTAAIKQRDGKPTVVMLDQAGKLSATTLEELKSEFTKDPVFGPLIAGSKASGGGAGGAGNGGGAALKRSEMSSVAKREFITANGQDAYLKLPK